MSASTPEASVIEHPTDMPSTSGYANGNSTDDSSNLTAMATALAAALQNQAKHNQMCNNKSSDNNQKNTRESPKAAHTVTPQRALYTIEQIELVRRLRNSGMSKEQMISAYESFDRLDHELGDVYSVPVSLSHQMSQHKSHTSTISPAQPHAASPAQPHTASHASHHGVTASPNSLHFTPASSTVPLQYEQPTTSHTHNMTMQNPVGAHPLHRKRSIDHVYDTSAGGVNQPQDSSVYYPHRYSTNPYGTPSHVTGNPELDVVEDMEEYHQFIQKGEPHCSEEIRNFILRYNIKQQQVAAVAGVSQSYVSRYCKGDFYDMSERSRRAIQKWYVMFSRNPAAIGPAANAMMLTNTNQQYQGIRKFVDVNSTSSSNVGDFTSYPRRERFVFRPAHLEVLEMYFNNDSYPSLEKRDEIARICNNTVDLGGRALSERETVTSQVVANWFANKRKEVKKIAREEGIDPSMMYLKGRGRPSKYQTYEMNLANMNSQHVSPDSSDNEMTMSNTHITSSTVSVPQQHNNTSTSSSLSATTHTTSATSGHNSTTFSSSDQPSSSRSTNPAAGTGVSVVESGVSTSGSGNARGFIDGTGSSSSGSYDSNSTQVNNSTTSIKITSCSSMQPSAVGNENNASGSATGKMSVLNEGSRIGTAVRPEDVSSVSQEVCQSGAAISAPPDDQSLSLAVEMAAVDQAIMSLSGQNPINIKAEKYDLF